MVELYHVRNMVKWYQLLKEKNLIGSVCLTNNSYMNFELHCISGSIETGSLKAAHWPMAFI